MFKSEKKYAHLTIAVSVLLLILLQPALVFGEGQDLGDLHHLRAEVKAEKEQKILEAASVLKQQIMAEKFKQVNGKLEDYAAMKFSEYVLEASRAFGIDPFLIASIMIKESHVKYKAKSRSAAYGLMQINWKVHRKNITSTFSQIQDLSDVIQPRNNILVGTYIFYSYLNASKGDVSKALSRYLGSRGTRYIATVLKHHNDMAKTYTSRIDTVISERVS